MAKSTGPILTDSEMAVLYSDAHIAGMTAVAGLNIAPMVVVEHSNPFDDSSEVVNRWVVPDGPCGFAWITISPANSRLARWLVSRGLARKNTYEGGVTFYVHDFNQSLAKKETYAHAFAKVFRDAGFSRVWAHSRMD